MFRDLLVPIDGSTRATKVVAHGFPTAGSTGVHSVIPIGIGLFGAFAAQ